MNLPEITYRYPTLVNGGQTLLPQITIDWSVDMETDQFSLDDERAKNIKLIKDETSTILDTSYVSYTAAQRRLIIQPSASLEANTTYRIIVKGRLASTDGRRSFNEYNWTFTTASGTVTTPTLLSPPDGSVQPIFPSVVWSTASASSLVTYEVQIDDRWDFGSPVYAVSTTATAVTPAGVFTEDDTYWWRVRATTTSATGAWTEPHSFYYGRQLYSDPTSRQFLPDQDLFGISSIGFKNGLSHQSAHPTLSFTFTSIPASDYSSYVEVTSKAVLPRNDDLDSYDSATVSGSWALSGSTLTFTPASAIATNTRYEITFLTGMRNTSGYTLNEEVRYYYTGRYSPLYVSPRVIRSRFLGAEQKIPDDLINFYIHMASLEANARYWAADEVQYLGDSLSEATVRDSANLTSYGVLKWVEAATVYKFLKAILSENLRDIGRTTRLGDSLVSLSEDFVKGLTKAMEEVKGELEQWENFLTPSSMPLTVPKNSGWSPMYWDYDLSVRDVEAKRDDWFR